jgi:hypothetical protein
MKTLFDNHKPLCSYQSAGKTVLGNDIWMFNIGQNPAVRILIDGAIHGMETYTSHTIYFLAEYILENNTPELESIKRRLQLCLIPILNYDNWTHAGDPAFRKNANGVDLNRNFVTGWCGGSSDPSSEYYKGAYAASEPETKVMRQLFSSLKPKVYVNMHDFGGAQSTLGDFRFPNFMGTQYTSECNTLFDRYQSVSLSRGLSVWGKTFSSAAGLARDDAAVAGAIAILNEEYYGGPTYDTVKNELSQKLLSLIIAVDQLYGAEPVPVPVLAIDWNAVLSTISVVLGGATLIYSTAKYAKDVIEEWRFRL